MHSGEAAHLLFHPMVGNISSPFPPPFPEKFISYPLGVYDNMHLWDLEVCEYHKTINPIRKRLLRGDITAREYGRLVIHSFCKSINLDELETSMEDV